MTVQPQLHSPCFSESFTFQTFDDKSSKNRSLIPAISGTRENINKHGSDVSITVNQIDCTRAKTEHIQHVRALCGNFDVVREEYSGDLVHLDIELSMVIKSSESKHHVYWILDNNSSIPLDQFIQLQKISNTLNILNTSHITPLDFKLHKVNGVLTAMDLIPKFDSKKRIHDWQEPEPLQLQNDHVENEYPLHAFPEIVQRAIYKAAFYNHVPYALAGQIAMGIMVYIAQEHVQAPSDKSKKGQPCSFGLFTIFESSGGKDETRNLLGKSIVEAENNAKKKFTEDLKVYKSLSRKEKAEIPYPINPQTIFSKTTTQGIVRAMARSIMDSFVWQTTEGAIVLGGYSLTSDTVGESLGIINNLIDQGSASSVLKGDEEPEFVINKRFSVDLSIQEVMAKKTLNSNVFKLQGFLARFMFSAPEPLPLKIITKSDRQIKADEDTDIIAFNNFCERLKNPSQKESSFIKSERILFNKSNEADDLHIEYENYINQQCADGGRYAHIRPNAKRTIQYCLRVAAVLAYFTPELDEIDANTIQSAIDLCKYSLDEWVRYYGNSEESDSQLLLTFLKKQKQPEIKKSYIQQNCPSKLRNKSSLLNDALTHLTDSGYITITESKPIKIILNPKC